MANQYIYIYTRRDPGGVDDEGRGPGQYRRFIRAPAGQDTGKSDVGDAADPWTCAQVRKGPPTPE